MKFILSPVGTSLLTNVAREIKANGKVVIDNSNVKNEEEISTDDKMILTQIIQSAARELSKADLSRAAQLSAEINGITKIYGGKLEGKSDENYLLRTDTWLGKIAAELVQKWLNEKGLKTQIKAQTDLQTKDFECFQLALSELVSWCAATTKSFRQAKYKIIFNLTGGFKSVQGFLQTLAMFYADEAVYVFESSGSLMRIPRLPIKMDAEESVKNNLRVFRRMALGLKTCVADARDLSETFLFRDGEDVSLSEWGKIVWEETYGKIYSEKLLPSFSEKLKYSDKFPQTLEAFKLTGNLITEMNKKIDDLARYLETNQDLRSLDLKKLKGNPSPPSTHEIDATSDNGARRLMGHYENSVFVLDGLSKHL